MRSTARSAGLAMLLAMNGCGMFSSSDLGTRTPGLSVAEAALQGGSGEIALQVSDGILRRAPKNVQALAIKGDALSLLGAYDQAEAIFNALMAVDPNSVRASIGLGRIRLSTDPRAAEVLFQKALRRDPTNLTALNNLGIARDLQGNHAAAQTAYRSALAVNPDLDSAQVNLALSMAMSGQGQTAVEMLKAKATQPDASDKVRHDYAAVLAMAGHRAEAERILTQTMDANEARQMLDGVTGAHPRVAGGASSDTSRASTSDDVAPDVVQVPETPARPAPASRLARIASPVADQGIAVAGQSAPPPTVVRPQQTIEQDSDVPPGPPVTPAAAALTYQHPLAAPLRASDISPPAGEPAETEADATIVSPKIVAMPRAVQPVPAPPVSIAAADTSRAITPSGIVARVGPAAPAPVAVVASPVNPVSAGGTSGRTPASISTSMLYPVTAAPVRKIAPVTDAPAAPELTATAPMRTASVAPATMASPVTPVIEPMRSPIRLAARTSEIAPGRERVSPADGAAKHGGGTASVQFSATGSEEAAYSFWQSLVHRFPDVLGQREPIVIRFDHNGAVFWRVRTESASLADAQALCAHMRASGQDCFVPPS